MKIIQLKVIMVQVMMIIVQVMVRLQLKLKVTNSNDLKSLLEGKARKFNKFKQQKLRGYNVLNTLANKRVPIIVDGLVVDTKPKIIDGLVADPKPKILGILFFIFGSGAFGLGRFCILVVKQQISIQYWFYLFLLRVASTT